MATASSVASGNRQARRRDDTRADALDHAIEVMTESGVGALSMTEVARRLGMRGPSLYKYFPSLHAVYYALFARGLAGNDEAITTALDASPPGVARLRAAARATVKWCMGNPALAQLLYWRPVPGFTPSPETFAASVRGMQDARAELAAAVALGELDTSADSDAALRLYTVLISGLISQQMANEPEGTFETGLFTRLTDPALDMFFHHYRVPRRT